MNSILSPHEHVWHFAKIGGKFRVTLNTVNDILNLDKLDQKLWTALSCPVVGLELDTHTLELIDTDKDGKIRVPEVLEALNWLKTVLAKPEILLQNQNFVSIHDINKNSPLGQQLIASTHQILSNLGKKDAQTISTDDTSDSIRIFSKTKFNGDGIITVESADDELIKAAITDIVNCFPGHTDRCGLSGVNTETLEQFYAQCAAYDAWLTESETQATQILPFGANTENALQAYLTIKEKVNDYFVRCQLAGFDPRSVDVLNTLLASFQEFSNKNLSENLEEVLKLPIAYIEADKDFPLEKGLNPAWREKVASFSEILITPLWGKKKSIDFAEWKSLETIFAPYLAWKSAKPVSTIESLGIDRIRENLKQNLKAEIQKLIDSDKALEAEANAIAEVDKLVRYVRDFYKLMRNYVSFVDFYSPGSKAIFQAGTLYIDQRSCDFCVKVNDMGKHNAFSNLSGIYLMYVDCVSRSRNEKMTIVVGLTDGDVDNLMPGRNAVFYDRAGNDWDATIVKIIENPISIRQAFWSPYKKMIRTIDAQIQKFASEKDKKMEESATSNIQSGATNLETKASTPKVEGAAAPPAEAAKPTPFDVGKFAGIFAAIGLALAAISTALVAVISGFMALKWWQMILSVFGLMLLISGPSMLLAWLKLRKRNLAPILDANGWAINSETRINIVFGKTLTHLAKLPKNARRTFKDPFAAKRPLWIRIMYWVIFLAAALLVIWKLGYIEIPFLK